MKIFILHQIYEGYETNIKNFLTIQNSIFPPKQTRCGKNVKIQNCSFHRDLQMSYRPFLHRSYIFCLLIKKLLVFKKTIRYEKNCSFRLVIHKKRYQKWKISFYTKSMRDTKKMLENKIVYFQNIQNFGADHFFI